MSISFQGFVVFLFLFDWYFSGRYFSCSWWVLKYLLHFVMRSSKSRKMAFRLNFFFFSLCSNTIIKEHNSRKSTVSIISASFNLLNYSLKYISSFGTLKLVNKSLIIPLCFPYFVKNYNLFR